MAESRKAAARFSARPSESLLCDSVMGHTVA
jgi:hypothetical protein